MNIINKVTWRYLKENKRRTLVTILGVIISTAMLTAVVTLFLALFDMMAREAIDAHGLWHAVFSVEDDKQLSIIAKDDHIDTIALRQSRGFADLHNDNHRKPYLYVEGFNQQALNNYHVRLLEGHLPTNSRELVVNKALLEDEKFPYQIGDEITLSLGERMSTIDGETIIREGNYSLYEDGNGERLEKIVHDVPQTFTIVGTIERPLIEESWSVGFGAVTLIEQPNFDNGPLSVSITAKTVNRELFDWCQSLANESETSVRFNNNLLKCYGVIYDDTLNQTLYGFGGILIIIIIIGSVSLIYNAFAISVAQRTRYLGLLSSVGATRAQKRNSVFFEGMLIGLISIPLGVISGLVGIWVTFLVINPMVQEIFTVAYQFEVVVTPWSIAVIVLFAALIIFISAYIPAHKASRVSAIDAIRQNKEVKLTKRNLKTSKLTSKIFGLEGELALKNLKRHRGRYYATVFSLIISVVLFISVSGFLLYLQESVGLTDDGINFDAVVELYSDEPEKEALLQEISEGSYVKDKTQLQYGTLLTALTETQAPVFYQTQGKKTDGTYQIEAIMISVNEDNLRQYARNAHIDDELLFDKNHPAAIVIGHMRYRTSSTTYERVASILAETGDQLPLFTQKLAENQESWEKGEAVTPITLAGFSDELLIGMSDLVENNTIYLVVSEEIHQLYNEYFTEGNIYKSLYLTTNDQQKMDETINQLLDGQSYMSYYNIYEAHLRSRYLMTIIRIFAGGFITLITAICVANIFNTISTSVMLRRQEFAMLKSVGMTPHSFYRMIKYESIFYGLKALLYGLPISLLVLWLMYRTIDRNFRMGFLLPYTEILITMAMVFIIVASTMLYAFSKVKHQNIVDGLKQENM